jgi:hypothetical protein
VKIKQPYKQPYKQRVEGDFPAGEGEGAKQRLGGAAIGVSGQAPHVFEGDARLQPI